jgi:hypothetical protein
MYLFGICEVNISFHLKRWIQWFVPPETVITVCASVHASVSSVVTAHSHMQHIS